MTSTPTHPNPRSFRFWLWFSVPFLLFLSRNESFFRTVLQRQCDFHVSVFLQHWLIAPVVLGLFLSMAYAVGSYLLDFITGGHPLSDPEDVAFSFALGLAAHSVIVMAVGIWAGVKPLYFLIEAAALLALCARRLFTPWIKLWTIVGVGRHPEIDVEETLALGLIAWIFLHGFIIALAPPIDSDSLGYHLGNAAQYIREGRIFYQTGYPFAAFPGTLEMNYLFAVALGQEPLAQLIPWSLSLALIGLILRAGQEFFGSLRVGILGAAVFAAQPVFTVALGTAMQDGSVALFVFASLYCLLQWNKTGADAWWRLGGVLAGLVIATKYSAAAFLPILFLVFLGLQIYSKRFSIKKLLVFTLLAAAVFAPWAVRNVSWTGNPVWPIANSFFGGRDFDEKKTDVLASIESLPGQERTIKGFAMLPWRMITQFRFGHYYNPEYLTWPFLALCAAMLWIRPAWPWVATYLLLFAALASAALYSTASYWRYFLPALPGICLVFGWMTDQARSRSKAAAFAILLLMSLAAVRLNSAHALYPALGFSHPSGSGTPRESYLRAKMADYPVYARIHAEVPEDEAVFLAEHYDSYYLKRAFVFADPLWQGRINYRDLSTPADLHALLRSWNVHWVVMNQGRRTVADPSNRERLPDWYWHGQNLIDGLIKEFGQLVEDQNGVALYRLINEK